MKSWKKIILSAFLCMLFISQVSIPAFAGVPGVGQEDDFRQNHATTEISLKSDFTRPVIHKISKDMEVAPNTEFTLEAELEGDPPTRVQWSLSSDGGKTYNKVGGDSAKLTTSLPENEPDYLPYIYQLQIENVAGVDKAFVHVLVSSTMKYEYKKLESNGVTVEGLIYKGVQNSGLAVIKQRPDQYPQLESQVGEGKVPLCVYEVRIIDSTGRYFPYIGTLDITFPVGGIFDSGMLRVFHQRMDGQIEPLIGGVNSGILKVSTDFLSPFLIETPRSLVQTVEVKVIGRGTVAPSGTVYIPRYEDQSFVMTGYADYEIKEVRLDGHAVSYSGNTYTQRKITQDHKLEVIFGKPSTGGGGGGPGGPGSGSGSGPGPGNGSGSGSGNSGSGPGNSGGGPGSELIEDQLVPKADGGAGSNSGGAAGGSGNSVQNALFYQISVKVKGKGVVSPTGTVSVRRGASKTFYFYPQTGYQVGKVLVNGVEMTVLGSSYTFTAVTERAKLEVFFEKQTDNVLQGDNTITATAGKGGAISPEGANTVPYGGDFYVYFQPEEGYLVSKVIVDGEETEIGDSYHFINVTEDRWIHVEFEKNDKVSAEANIKRYEVKVRIRDGNGTVSPQGDIWVNEGGSQTVYFYPSDGYKVSDITVNGKATGLKTESYTLENVREDMEVEVTFASGKSKAFIVPVCWLILLLILALILFIGRRIHVRHLKKMNRRRKNQEESKDRGETSEETKQ